MIARINNPTTFTNLSTAQTAINKALKEKSKEIAEWLEDGKSTPFRETVKGVGKNLGVGYVKLSNGQLQKKEGFSNVFIMLKKSDKSESGFVVYTSYPVD